MSFDPSNPGPIGAVKDDAIIHITDAAENVLTFLVEGREVGKLFMGPPMRFEGDADESAKAFFVALENFRK